MRRPLHFPFTREYWCPSAAARLRAERAARRSHTSVEMAAISSVAPEAAEVGGVAITGKRDARNFEEPSAQMRAMDAEDKCLKVRASVAPRGAGAAE